MMHTCGISWQEPVQSSHLLPYEAPPGTAIYVEDEDAAYMFDGIGWVMFCAPHALHTSGRERLRITAEGDMIVNTEQANEALRTLHGIWTCEHSQGEIWVDQSVIDELDATLQASEAWNAMVELYGKKPKKTVLSSRS